MTNYAWKFTMGTKKEPTWEVFSESPVSRSLGKFRLIAYAKRAKDIGWFVRISGVNENVAAAKIYIGDDVFPPDFMTAMLGMNKLTN
jgi:hypothetical protein